MPGSILSNEMGNKVNKSLRKKFIIILVIIFAVLWLIMSFSIAFFYRYEMEEKYKATAYSQADIAADYIDGDKIKEYEKTLEKDDYYYETLDFLRNVKESSDLKYLYICIPQDTGYFYIWDAGDPDSDEGVCDLGDADEYYQGGDVVMKGAFDGSIEKQMLVTNSPVYGYVASAFVPVYDSAGNPVALSSVDISMDVINNDIADFIKISAITMIVIMILVCAIFYCLISAIVLNPISKLDGIVRSFVSEQMKQGEVLNIGITSGDEIEDLSKSFEEMSVELKNYMEDFEKATREKERIGAELNVATQIQADMLPSIFPPYPDRTEFDIFASMDPAKEVGGDFYDFFMTDDNHVALVMADVSGKGVPAALFMVIAKTLIKNRTMRGGTPSEILADVNDQLLEGNKAELFVTVWLAIIDINTGEGLAANAGHEHPALKKAGGAFELVKYRHSPAVATMEGIPFREHEFKLDRGDIVFVYTDGLTEATNSSNELFGEERVIESLNSAPDAGIQDLLRVVRADVDGFVGEAPQFDDLTMLAFILK